MTFCCRLHRLTAMSWRARTVRCTSPVSRRRLPVLTDPCCKHLFVCICCRKPSLLKVTVVTVLCGLHAKPAPLPLTVCHDTASLCPGYHDLSRASSLPHSRWVTKYTPGSDRRVPGLDGTRGGPCARQAHYPELPCSGSPLSSTGSCFLDRTVHRT